MRKPLHTIWILVIALIINTAAPILAAPKVTAPATNTSGQALEISPPVIDLVANPGQVITQNISIRNVSSGSLIVSGSADDFTSSGEDGRPKLLLDPGETSPYTMKAWVRPLPRMLIVPREIKTLKVTIAVPATASPGGHYGVIRFTATPPELDGQGVSLSASLGSLALIRVNGQVSESMKVAEFSVNKDGKKGTLFQSAPLNFIERLKNDGNVHTQPVGQVQIDDMFGRRLANLNINVPPRNVLPASIRKFEAPLNHEAIGNKFLFGHYHAKLKMTYGTSKKPLVADIGFWVIPYKLIITIIILLIITFLLLRYLLRRYNRYIIAKSGGRRPPSQPKPQARPQTRPQDRPRPKPRRRM